MDERSGEHFGPSIDIVEGPPPEAPPPQLPATSGGGGSTALSIIALIAGLVGCALGAWALITMPAPPPPAPTSPAAVPGATAERVAKLEKDVSRLMLELITTQKELRALRARAGAITKLSELSAKVAALTKRVDDLALELSIRRLKNRPAPSPKAQSAQPAKAPTSAAKPQPEARPKPAPRKIIYKVRKGDTLFTIAQRYKVSMRQLRKWNKLGPRSVLKVGQKLVIYK